MNIKELAKEKLLATDYVTCSDVSSSIDNLEEMKVYRWLLRQIVLGKTNAEQLPIEPDPVWNDSVDVVPITISEE